MTKDKDLQQQLEQAVQEHAQALQAFLAEGDWAAAAGIMAQVNDVRNQTLYEEVGKLTCELHGAILDLQLDAGNPHAQEISRITDAAERLHYVVRMTENAANETIDLVESSAPLVNYISYEAQSLLADWQRFTRREMPLDEFRELARRVEEFLTRSLHDSDQLSSNLNSILLAQGFQDLTGQVIKRVSSVIAYVEESLLKMKSMASAVDQAAGIRHGNYKKDGPGQIGGTSSGEGPQIHADTTADVVADQVDVDDLLSSLGL